MQGDNVEGLVAQRQALVAFLRSLKDDEWRATAPSGATVADVVHALLGAYAAALAGSLDQPRAERDIPGDVADDAPALVEGLDRLGSELERTFAERADQRWELPTERFGDIGGTAGMGIAPVLLDVHRKSLAIGEALGRAVVMPEVARDAAVAAAVWLASDRVDGAARVVFDDGDEVVVGSGPADVTVHTDNETVLAVATDGAALDAARRSGRWRVEGPDDAVERFESSFAASCVDGA